MLDVITSASSFRLTTANALRHELGGVQAEDSDIERLIDDASAAIARWCGRVFAVETVREVFHEPLPAASVVLCRWPIAEISSALAGNQPIPLTEVEADKASGIVYRISADGRRAAWPAGRISITYKAGFVLPGAEGRTLPSDIERAALVLARHFWFGRGRDPALRSEDVEGVGTASYNISTDALPLDVESLLTPYRMPMVA